MNTGSVNATSTSMNPAMELALSANFGSAAGWRADVLGHLRRDPSIKVTVQLVFHPHTGSLQNQALFTTAEVCVPSVQDAVTLLTLTVGPQASAEDVVNEVDWTQAYALYQTAVHDASEGFEASQNELADAILLDVRRAGMFQKAQTMIPGAQWHDPALVSHWAHGLPRDQAVVVYCIYGHEVGRSTALRLRAEGVDARFLAGGIDAWQAAGLPLVARS
jgi:superoxide dismutase, Fe-Mn family